MSNAVSFISEADMQTVNAAIREAVAGSFEDVELVELRYFKQYGSAVVELLIWKRSGVTLADCEAVHNVASAKLDEFDDMFLQPYMLNVSSLGLDRRIEVDDDFRRALDSDIECFTADKKKIHGILTAFDKDTVTLQKDQKNITISRNNLTKVQPYVRF